MKRLLLLLITIITLQSCDSSEQDFLDESIPRLQSPADQIASLRTKWHEGSHVETVFYDHQGRVIERFKFGRSSGKELHFYEGDLQKRSIYHSHSDSSEPGYVSVDTVTREFDVNGRLILEVHAPAELPKRENLPSRHYYERHLMYTAKGDTIERLEGIDIKRRRLDYTDRWERDGKNLLKRHYRFHVISSPDSVHRDTVYEFSQKFAYDAHGRLALAWYDSMYLGEHYSVPGPDTIWYRYNSQNQLSEEERLHTADMRNKREADTTRLSRRARESVNIARQNFIYHTNEGSSVRYLITYKYEKFDAGRHSKLIIPTN